MKAFTVWQPWASLIMIGAKPYEFRGRSYLQYIDHPHPGERIVIHSAARPVRRAEIEDLLARIGGEGDATGLVVDRARPLLERILEAHRCQALPLGCGLGTAVIGNPRNSNTIYRAMPRDSDRGDFNWAWPLSDIQTFDTPIPARGFQSFWRWTASKVAA